MKKLQKIISITFFGLVVFAFFLSFINDIGSIGGLIMAFEQFDYTWSQIISWFIDLGISIAIFVISLLALIRVAASKEHKPVEAMNKNCLCLAIYGAASIFAEILVIIHASSLSAVMGSSLAILIVLIVFQLVYTVSLFVSLAKFENPLVNKVLRYVGHGALFVSLILTVANGAPAGLLIAFIIFMFFVNIVGLAQVIICGFEVKEPVQTVEQNEEQSANTEATTTEEHEKEEPSDLENRLLKLNHLHSQGLLSDEEYNEKRKQIIDSL